MITSLSKLLIFLFLFSQMLVASTSILEKVSLQLQWKHQFEFAGFYIAKEKGFYKEMGIEVDIKEYEFGIDVVDDVSDGKATFGTSYPSVVAKESNGANLVLLTAILQNSPHVLVSLDSSGINDIKDFKNKTIMINNSEAITASFLSMLRANGVSLDEMQQIDETFNIQDLIDGKTDIKTAFISNELYYLDKNNIKYKVWDPKDYGFDFYDVMLFTSKDYLQNNKTVVDNFTKASIKGWQYAFENIEESVELILKKYNSQNKTKEALIYEANVLKKLAYQNTTQLGKIDKEKIKHIYNIYTLLGLTKDQIDWDEFIYDGYLTNTVDFTKEERSWIKNNPEVSIALMPDFSPFSYIVNGAYVGLEHDLLSLISKKSGLNFKKQFDIWNKNLTKFKNRQVDIIIGISHNKEREDFTLFTSPYYKIPIMIFIRKDFESYKNINSLKGKKVGILKDVFFVKDLKKIDGIELIVFETYEEITNALVFGEIDALIHNLPNIYLLIKKNAYTNLKIAEEFKLSGIDKEDLRFGINSDKPLLKSIIQKSLDEITPQEYAQLTNKWLDIDEDNTNKSIAFTKEEKNYFDQKESLKICADPDFLPYEKIDENGVYQGIGSEIMQIISKSLNKSVELVSTTNWSESLQNIQNGKCDILPMAASTISRQDYLNFTKPYIQDSIVVVTENKQFFINGSKDLSNRKIGIVKDYSFIEQVKQINPKIEIVKVKNILDGLEKVQQGQLYGYIDALSVVAYTIQKYRLLDLKVTGRLEFDLELRIASRKDQPHLASIISKALQEIDKEQINAIRGKWATIKVEESFDYKILIYMVIIFLVILAFMIYRHNNIKQMNKELEKVSITDALTDIYNRRYFNELFPKVINSAKRKDELVSFLIMDIDHFKQYNDTYGHQRGDNVLIKVAKAIKDSLHRADDYCFRLGGEEFGVIFKAESKEQAGQFAHTIRQNIENLHIEHPGNSASSYVTVSMGLVCKNANEIKDEDEVYKQGDDLLYKAKESGRNRVEFTKVI